MQRSSQRSPCGVSTASVTGAGWPQTAQVRGWRRRALAEGVDACPHCRPDSELGFIDG
ncbi:DUF6233 domain-containing protein [Streptomyces sp. NPDC001530]|uniref:DUF6233 domain-containing protein n=1 Tax=Streptomyces sp. NPDC001530 TaxID=3364582 RepID=UPI00367DD9EA